MSNYESKYFKPAEFACKCGCGEAEVAEKLLRELDKIREHFGVPVSITSGRRCKKHNAKVGGATNSQHVLGTAADIVVKGVSPDKVYKYLSTTYPDRYGIGLYKSFTHFDVRPQKARW